MHQNAFGSRALPETPKPQSGGLLLIGKEERKGRGWGEEGKKVIGRGRHGEYISILDLSIDGLTVNNPGSLLTA